MTGAPSRGLFPWHPVLLTASLVIGFWADTLVHPAAAIRSLLVAVVVAVLLVAAIHVFRRDGGKTAAVVSAVLLLLWTKHLVRFCVAVARWLSEIQVVILGLLMVVAVALALRIVLQLAPRAWSSPDLTLRLNRGSALLLVAVLLTSALTSGFETAADDLTTASPGQVIQAPGPDVYVILLDGYARADVLQHVFDYDNSPFVEALRAREFSVARTSHTPYFWTHLVLPSVLHRDYVDSIPALTGAAGGVPDQVIVRHTINHNPVFDDFRERGYRIVATNSGYEQYSLRAVDDFFDAGEMNEFELELLLSTFLGDLMAITYPDIGSRQLRRRIETSLDYLPSIAAREDPQPALVFAHIPAPHQPTVFGPNGEAVVTRLDSRFFHDTFGDTGVPLTTFIDQYTGEVTHLNKLVLASIDRILEESSRPPVIVVMSDHGSASRVNWLATSTDDADPIDLVERSATLFAAYTPGQHDVFPDDVVPVDVFRLVSDAYFGTDFGEATPPPGGRQLPAIPAPWEARDGPNP